MANEKEERFEPVSLGKRVFFIPLRKAIGGIIPEIEFVYIVEYVYITFEELE